MTEDSKAKEIVATTNKGPPSSSRPPSCPAFTVVACADDDDDPQQPLQTTPPPAQHHCRHVIPPSPSEPHAKDVVTTHLNLPLMPTLPPKNESNNLTLGPFDVLTGRGRMVSHCPAWR